MLQEILLSLSGYPSTVWEKVREDIDGEHSFRSYVSEPERAMLQVLAHISALHIQIRESSVQIAKNHRSLICRAVASAVSSKHLADFQDKILDVETSILTRDANYVGGYDIVPLSTIVGEFSPWTKRMEWLQRVTEYANQQCTGSDMLNFLQSESRTGFADIESMATQLLTVGQRGWLRLLASWVLYGRLPVHGAEDFFIRALDNSGRNEFTTDSSSLPKYVTPAAADSILSIGKALTQIQLQAKAASHPSTQCTTTIAALIPQTLRYLERLTYPINQSAFESAMTSINRSISQNALSQLLPINEILELLEAVHRYILLGSGEFSTSLINRADERMLNRQQHQASNAPVRKLGRLDNLTIKDTEMSGILAKTWAELALLQAHEATTDRSFILGRKFIVLTDLQEREGGDRVPVISTLLSNKAALHLNLPTDSSTNFFFEPADREMYSTINAFLLSLRRAQIHISDLWKMTSQRRCHPTPIGPPVSATDWGRQSLATRNQRELRRGRKTRQHWATAHKVHFITNELGHYFHGEVIDNSWRQFKLWLTNEGSNLSTSSTTQSKQQETTASRNVNVPAQSRFADSSGFGREAKLKQTDPRALAQGHRKYLQAMYSALLLEDYEFLNVLDDLFPMLDHFVALFHRLQTVWAGLDLQDDDGVVDAFSNYVQDEKDILEEMIRSRHALENTLASLMASIKAVERTRTSESLMSGVIPLSLDEQTFIPWRARTMDRLIMRLDALNGSREQEDESIELVENYEDD